MGTKRQRGEEETPEAALRENHPRWDDLSPDALSLIFIKVSIPERVAVIPRVCKSWSQAVTQPLCWQEIDLLPWTNRRRFDLHMPWGEPERTVQMLVAKSSGTLRTLRVYGLRSDSIFTFIAQNAGCLRTLIIPGSKIGDSMVEQIAGRLSSVTFIDVSYCINMGACGLEVIGNNCKLLEGLCRKMGMWDIINTPRDDEAMAIAYTMPNLKHLDIGGHSMTTEGVYKIVVACSKLEYLSLSGCDHVELQNLGVTRNRFPKLVVSYNDNDADADGEGSQGELTVMERELREFCELLDGNSARVWYNYKAGGKVGGRESVGGILIMSRGSGRQVIRFGH